MQLQDVVRILYIVVFTGGGVLALGAGAIIVLPSNGVTAILVVEGAMLGCWFVASVILLRRAMRRYQDDNHAR